MKHLLVTEYVENLLKEKSFNSDSPLSIKSISEKLHLSPITVKKGLKPFLDENILCTVKGKGIYPNKNTQYSKTVVGLVVTTSGHFFSELTTSLAWKLNTRNVYTYILDRNEARGNCTAAAESLLAQHPQSVIIDGSIYIPPKFLDALQSVRKVFIHDYETSDKIPDSGVMIDFEEGSFTAARHLIELGYENIVLSNPQPSKERVNRELNQRLAGYGRALKDAGLSRRKNIFWWDRPDGKKPEKELLSLVDGFKGKCAFICSSDWEAVEIMKTVQNAGRKVPEDIAFIGFYNTPWTEYAPVSLSSMCINVGELTDLAVDLALSESGNNAMYKICPSLILRDSCPAVQKQASSF